MTESYEELLQKIQKKGTDYAKHLTELNNLNNDARDKVDKLLKEMNTNTQKQKQTSCDVCYSRQKTHATVPCYHTYCENCAGRALNRNKCFQCRGQIDSVVRIYI